eukprot:6621496-Alexandrium_andersonii.AAC.1
MSLDSSEEFVDCRFVDPTTAAQLNQFYMELRAKLAQVDSELGALTGRVASIEVTTMSQEEAAAHVLQRHEAAGQAHQGHLIELRDAAVAHSGAIQ